MTGQASTKTQLHRGLTTRGTYWEAEITSLADGRCTVRSRLVDADGQELRKWHEYGPGSFASVEEALATAEAHSGEHSHI